MGGMILLHIENRFLKATLLKSIAQANFVILDVIDIDDLSFKLDSFGSKVCLAIFEITDYNMNAVGVEIDYLKKSLYAEMPIMAIVSKDTADVVTFSMRAGIQDVLLLPAQRELYHSRVNEKMNSYYQQFASSCEDEVSKPNLTENIMGNTSIKDAMQLELRHAQRGGYPLAFILAYLTPEGEEIAKTLFFKVKEQLRTTDKIYMINDETFIGLLPFTYKKHCTIIEQKIREAFDNEVRRKGGSVKLNLFTTSFPDDDTELSLILERLENGVNNSAAINSIRSPLNDLSKAELESYRQKIRQYKKFL